MSSVALAFLRRSRCSNGLLIRANARSFSSSQSRTTLAGTVPHHQSYILLHTHLSPSEYPAKSKSALWKMLTLQAKEWGGLVNFSWSPNQPVHPRYTGVGEDSGGEEELYYATAFSVGCAPLRIPEISFANMEEVVDRLRAHMDSTEFAAEKGEDQPEMDEGLGDDAKLQLYVCTHGSRDCRCGDTGGAVAKALEEEIAKRNLWDRVSLGETAHVGGHKYAANVLVFPFGDWLGTIQPEDVPRVLSGILDRQAELHSPQFASSPHKPAPPLCQPFWRGRMGVDKDGQTLLASQS